MKAGNLNEIITIEEPLLKINEFGEMMDNKFKKKFTTRAEVKYIGGNKIIENSEIVADYSIQFIIRIYHKVTETDRVIFRNKAYNIDSIEYSRQYQLIKLNCSMANE